jgi:hypothetical protein
LVREASPNPSMLIPTNPREAWRVVRSHISWQRTAEVIDSCAFPDRLQPAACGAGHGK